MGYVPLFDSLVTGTLHGRWPDIGLWPVLLSLANRFGDIDVTANYIASVTGLDLAEVEACIARFCAPDRHSRSQTDDGRRLVPLDSHRAWGWHIVNHAYYREKARLTARDAARTESGADAARKRAARDCPPLSPDSPGLPPSDSNKTHTQIRTKNPSAVELPIEFESFKSRYPLRLGSQPWRRAARALAARVAEGSSWEEISQGLERYRDFCIATGKLGTEFVMQAATFVGPERRYLETWALPGTNGHGLDGSTGRSAIPTKRSPEMDRAFEEGLARARSREEHSP